MLDKKIQEQIVDFVRQKPRTMQEIATLIQKNWRTADRYIQTIQTETGLLAIRTFREGSRGALKIVYWNALDPKKEAPIKKGYYKKLFAAEKKKTFLLLKYTNLLINKKGKHSLKQQNFQRTEK